MCKNTILHIQSSRRQAAVWVVCGDIVAEQLSGTRVRPCLRVSVCDSLLPSASSPGLVLQQALNEPPDSWLRSCGDQLLRESQPAGSALLRLSCQPRTSVSEPRPCQMTLRPAEVSRGHWVSGGSAEVSNPASR